MTMDLLERITAIEDEVNLPVTSPVGTEVNHGRSKCVFRAPIQMRETNVRAYRPLVYCLGPMHRHLDRAVIGRPPMGLERKRQYYQAFRHRGVSKEAVIETVRRNEDKIRRGYEEEIQGTSSDLIEMFLVDACFIVECIMKFHDIKNDRELGKKDPIFSSMANKSELCRDLILLENQIPFCVLEDIYGLTPSSQEIPFLDLCCEFFQAYNIQHKKPRDVSGPLQFVDLLRKFILPPNVASPKDRIEGTLPNVKTATKLHRKGLIFQAIDGKSWVDIQFQKGERWYSSSVLYMPQLIVDDATEGYLRNLIAFEQKKFPLTACIGDYIALLNCLVEDKRDVEILISNHIIVDHAKDVKAVFKMIKGVKLYVTHSNISPKYQSLFEGLVEFYNNPITTYKAELRNEYFSSPWRVVYSIGKVVVFLVGIHQCLRKVIFWIKPYF